MLCGALKRPVITTEQLCKREAISQNVLGDSDIKYTYVFKNTDSNKNYRMLYARGIIRRSNSEGKYPGKQ